MNFSKRVAHILALTAVAVPVVASAAVAAPAGPPPAYGIVTSALTQIAKGPGANLPAADTGVTPCLGAFENLLPVNGSTVVNPAATPLLGELYASYTATALGKSLAQLGTMGTQLGKLHGTTKPIKTLSKFAPVVSGLAGLQFCTDLTTWSASGFATASEPSGTRAAATLTAALSPPSVALQAIATARRPLGLTLTKSQASKLKAVAKKAYSRLGDESAVAQARVGALVSTTAPTTPSGPTGPTGPTGPSGATGATGPTS